MDITAPEARPVVERLLRWADVVLHNFRVGVSERLGIDEAAVAALNPGRRVLPRQRLRLARPAGEAPGQRRPHAGADRVRAGHRRRGQRPDRGHLDPRSTCPAAGWRRPASSPASTPGPRPAGASGWRRASSAPGCCCTAGCSWRDGEVVRGPALDADQTGYGPGYRLYRWPATAPGWRWSSPTPRRGERLLPEAPALPAAYTPAARRADRRRRPAGRGRAGGGVRRGAGRPSGWPGSGRSACWPRSVDDLDRDRFRRGILDDPVNRQLGRVVAYETADWGASSRSARCCGAARTPPAARRCTCPASASTPSRCWPSSAARATRSTPCSPAASPAGRP